MNLYQEQLELIDRWEQLKKTMDLFPSILQFPFNDDLVYNKEELERMLERFEELEQEFQKQFKKLCVETRALLVEGIALRT